MFAVSRNKAQTIQPRLKIGQPDDKYEREADRVADAVMRMPDSQLQMQPVKEEEDEVEKLQMAPEAPRIQQMCPRCRERARQGKPLDCPECEKKLQMSPAVQRQSDGHTYASPEISSQLSSSKGRGTKLPSPLQQEMSSKMGTDFSGVNIHTDSKAHRLNQQLGAKAFTHGKDVYFNKGAYNSNSQIGKWLLAHELTHVIQQQNLETIGIQRQANCTPLVTEVLPSEENPREQIAVAHDWAIWIVDEVITVLNQGQNSTLLSTHFGNASTNAVANRYQRILSRLGQGVGIYRCTERSDPGCQSEDGQRHAAFEQCPSGAMETCNICPHFFRQTRFNKAFTLIHEAAHAIGACDHTGSTLGNANSYEDFARAVIGQPARYVSIWE